MSRYVASIPTRQSVGTKKEAHENLHIPTRNHPNPSPQTMMFLTQFLAISALQTLCNGASLLHHTSSANINLPETPTNLTAPPLCSNYVCKFRGPLPNHNAYLRATFFEDSRILARNIQDVLATVTQQLTADVRTKGDGTMLPGPLRKHSRKFGAKGCWFSTKAPSGPPSRFTYGVLLEAVERLDRFLPEYSYVMYAEVHGGEDGLGGWIGSLILEDHAPLPRVGVSGSEALE